MKKPIIGITMDYIEKDSDDLKYSNFPWYALRQQYANIVLKNGGIPIFLPFESYKEDLNEIMQLIDGLLIPGGDFDVPPSMYNEEILFDTVPNYERCNSEVKIMQAALDNDMPILAICHGMQLLNVLQGGSLYQNIKEQIPNSLNHKQPGSLTHTAHKVKIETYSLLAKFIESDEEFMINSRHRQAIKRLGKDMFICAICPEDSVIEAIESVKHTFVLGVEWHPETEASSKQDNKIINRFIESAQLYNRYGRKTS